MSKQAIIIIVIIAIILIILFMSMWSKAQAAKLAAQTQYSTAQKSQKVNVADIGNFVGGLIGGIKVAKDEQEAKDAQTT